MSGIDQMQLRFVAQQDRLLLRVNSQDRQQLRFWLTRRIVKRLLPPLLDVLRKAAVGDRTADPDAAAALFEYAQRNVREQVDFATEFDDTATSLPLGEDGLLVETVSLTGHDGGDVSIRLADRQGLAATLRLNPKLLHSLFAILGQALSAADWDLPMPRADADTAVTANAPNGRMH